MGLEITKRGYKAADAAGKVKFKKMSELLAIMIIVDYEIGWGNMDENFLEANDSTAEEINECLEMADIEIKVTTKETKKAIKTCVKNGWLQDEDEPRD